MWIRMRVSMRVLMRMKLSMKLSTEESTRQLMEPRLLPRRTRSKSVACGWPGVQSTSRARERPWLATRAVAQFQKGSLRRSARPV
jgi:hypothetical protein